MGGIIWGLLGVGVIVALILWAVVAGRKLQQETIEYSSIVTSYEAAEAFKPGDRLVLTDERLAFPLQASVISVDKDLGLLTLTAFRLGSSGSIARIRREKDWLGEQL